MKQVFGLGCSELCFLMSDSLVLLSVDLNNFSNKNFVEIHGFL